MAITEGFEPPHPGPWPDGLSVSLCDLIASAETRTQIYGNGPYAGRRRRKHIGWKGEARTLDFRFIRTALLPAELLSNIGPGRG